LSESAPIFSLHNFLIHSFPARRFPQVFIQIQTAFSNFLKTSLQGKP